MNTIRLRRFDEIFPRGHGLSGDHAAFVGFIIATLEDEYASDTEKVAALTESVRYFQARRQEIIAELEPIPTALLEAVRSDVS